MRSILFVLALAGCGYELNNPLEPCVDPKGGFHVCADKCVDNTDLKNCGSSCTPCESAHGTASCDGTRCSIACATGFHECGGKCRDNLDPMSCGSMCNPCPVVNGKATCDGKVCGVACNTGFHLCSGTCLASNSINSCGTRCTACPASPPHSTGSCQDIGSGLECVFQCNSGFSACGSGQGTCGCGSSCAQCTANQSCNGVSCV